MLRCPALAGRTTGVPSSVEPLAGHVLTLVAFPLTSRPAAPASRAARTPAPPRRAPATAPPLPPAVRHHRVPLGPQQHTHVVPPMSSSVLGPAEILQHDPGLAASPPVRHTLRVARSEISLPCLLAVRCGPTPFSWSGAAPSTAVHIVGPGGCGIGVRVQPRHEVLLFVGKARTTSSAPPFSRTSSRNASAGRSSPNGLPPSLTVALAQMTEVRSIRHGSATRGMSGRPQRRGHSVETELVALDVLHHEARLVVAIGRQ